LTEKDLDDMYEYECDFLREFSERRKKVGLFIISKNFIYSLIALMFCYSLLVFFIMGFEGVYRESKSSTIGIHSIEIIFLLCLMMEFIMTAFAFQNIVYENKWNYVDHFFLSF
jgi:hypothetical protein